MAKIVITNQNSAETSSGKESTRREFHFLDVWGDTPPTSNTANMSFLTSSTSTERASAPRGPAIPRHGVLKTTLVNLGLIIG